MVSQGLSMVGGKHDQRRIVEILALEEIDQPPQAPMLKRIGFSNIRTLAVAIVNPDLHENTFAWWIARLMAAYAVERGVAAARADEWLAALDAAERQGEFFFSSVPILTTAIAN